MSKVHTAMRTSNIFADLLLGCIDGLAAYAAFEEAQRKEEAKRKLVQKKRNMLDRNWQHCRMGREFDLR